jgi:glyoxylase-like metal-dependent hydrolase (beta-lactamase superfamily II)/ABC-type molybdate transport system substrate-binding protein
MSSWKITAAVALAATAMSVPQAAAQTEELRVLASNGVKAALEELVTACEQATGRRLAIRFNSSTALKAIIDGGDAFDVALVTSDLMDDLVKGGRVTESSRAAIARVGIGVGVRAGAPKPDIASPEALKQALLQARAVTYAQDGASRVHVERMFGRLGITQAMSPKTILEQGSIRSTARVAQGDADLVLTLISEILPIKGIELVGPLPAAFQYYVSFSAGVGTHARQPEAAAALVQVLTSVLARETLTAKGLDPPIVVAAVGQPLHLYVMDCGVLSPTAEGVERYHVSLSEVGETRMAVPCFLVVHPRGRLLWDLGVIPDAEVGAQPGGARSSVNPTVAALVTRTLSSQLAQIGYRPSDMTYIAISHAHIDHSANMNAFAGSTWLARAAERNFMWAEGNTRVRPAFYSALRNREPVVIDKDEYDVFGDGKVVIKSAPGHTPGHQVLILNLAATGRVMLSGDIYHYPQERQLHRPPPDNEANVQQSADSRVAIEEYLRKTGTTLWIEHDFAANSKLMKSPAYYD